ncbi:MAG: outer membrane lipoprotein-sorting protein [Sinimarinibacterium sp.]|jgi:hypothetical protein
MNKLKAAAQAALVLLCSVAAARAQDAKSTTPRPQTVDDIQACMQRNLVQRGALRDLNLDVRDREGNNHALRLKLYWKPSAKAEARVNVKLLEPRAMSGSSYLMLQSGDEESVYFHLPPEPKAIQITGKNTAEPLWGTDFSYGEIKQVLGLLYSGQTTRTADGVYATRPAFVLETATDVESSGYRKVVSYVDQGSCVLLKSEFFAKADKPLKLLEADAASILSVDDYSVVLDYTMRNLQEGTRTQVKLSDFTILERLPERLFDPQHFFEAFE